LVYDLDGTLLETLPDLHLATNLALADRGHPPVTLEAARSAIGDGARILVQRLCPAGSSEEEVDRTLERFHHHYGRVCLQDSTLRDGALDFVRRRAGTDRFQAILTNKPQSPTDRLVDHFGLRQWIFRSQGGDTPFGRKPSPEGLRGLIHLAGASPETTLVIGDGPADLEVARAGGCKCVRLDGGYGNPAQLDALPSDWQVGSFAELESLWPSIEG
jgi:phosphoglycolate phosphatase